MNTINAILHVPKTHVSRMEAVFFEEIGKDSTPVRNLLFFKDVTPDSFLDLILEGMKIWQYIYRLYLYDHISEAYDDILELNFTGKKLRIQAYPKELEEKLLRDMDPLFCLDPTGFSHFLSVVRLDGKYYYGLFSRQFYFRKPESKHPVSRSYYKISEAVQRFHIPLKGDFTVLDVGAAPGGWTEFMSKRVKQVIAVDPAELDFQRENVIHVPQMLGECIDDVKTYQPFNIILCDINQDPRETARLLNRVLPFLAARGHTLVTIKLVFKGHETRKQLIQEMRDRLTSHFENISVKWLLANTKGERTLFGKK